MERVVIVKRTGDIIKIVRNLFNIVKSFFAPVPERPVAGVAGRKSKRRFARFKDGTKVEVPRENAEKVTII